MTNESQRQGENEKKENKKGRDLKRRRSEVIGLHATEVEKNKTNDQSPQNTHTNQKRGQKEGKRKENETIIKNKTSKKENKKVRKQKTKIRKNKRKRRE